MTCVVAVLDREQGNVIVGADSNSSSGHDSVSRKDKKIFRNGPFVIGYTTSYRMGQLLQYVFKPPPVTRNLHGYMVRDFIEAARSTLIAGGWASKHNNTETGGDFIVAYQDRIFVVQSDFQVAEYAEPFAAVGCGESFALGALRTMTLSEKTPARNRCREALRVAALSSGGVEPPFHLIQTQGGG